MPQDQTTYPSERLILALAAELKLPWLQVAHAAELARDDDAPKGELLDTIELSSQAALRLIDSYLLSAQLGFGQVALELEPVSISSMLFDVAHTLESYAQTYNCRLELDVRGKYGPVMAHRRALEAALLALGHSFIEAAQGVDEKATVRLVLRRSSVGISTGMFSSVSGLSGDLLNKARRLYGRARQPLSGFSAGSGAGVFVADALLGSMDSRLRASHYDHLAGLAAVFVPSKQLSLV